MKTRYFVLTALSLFLAAPAALASRDAEGSPKVVLFIGDGFGAGQMSLGIAYGERVEGRKLAIQGLMEEGNTGYTLAYSAESQVTDSAAGATQIGTGQRVLNETIGLSASGDPVETILEWAEEHELSTGLVTNMRLTHATPASFAAHQISRYVPEPDIADDMLARNVEVLLGGGARAFVPSGTRVSSALSGVPDAFDGPSNRRDDADRVSEASSRGYAVVSDLRGLRRESARATKLLGLFSASHLPYVVDRRALNLDDRLPSVAEMAEAALEVLERSPQGFFLMVEGGRIDYAGHENDAGSMLQEILDFDRAVGAGLDFQRRHPETLVIVTADHGTGGFSFTYGDGDKVEPRKLGSGLEYAVDHRYPGRAELETLGRQSASYVRMLDLAGTDPKRLIEVVRQNTGLALTEDEAKRALARDAEGRAFTVDFRQFYGDQESNPACLLGRALARQTYVVWSTGGHTTDPVLTFGRGPFAERLRGAYWNTHIYDVMKDALSR